MKTQITMFAFAVSALLLSLSASAACHFPPTRPQPSLKAYSSGEKIFAEQKKLTACMRQGVATIAYATQDGVFCSNVKNGTFSHHNLAKEVVQAYSDHKPFAIYYNGKPMEGKDGGIMFSKNEECAPGETARLTVSASDGTCGDFENSTAEYKGKTPGSSLARYIHVGADEVTKCQSKLITTANKDSNKNVETPIVKKQSSTAKKAAVKVQGNKSTGKNSQNAGPNSGTVVTPNARQ